MNFKDFIGCNIIEENKVKRTKLQSGISTPYKGKGTKCCNQLKETSTFNSQISKRKYDIRENMNCKDSHLIYLITCAKCYIQYVGMTEQPANDRISQHHNDGKKTK